jgi:REP element-mobilizing transposase RayT
MNHDLPQHRHSIRLKTYDYSQVGAYFITICAHHHVCLFGEISNGIMQLNNAGKIIKEGWLTLSDKFLNIRTDFFVVMPNHFHGIINIESANFVGAIHELPLHRRGMLLPKIIGYFKMNTGKRINQLRQSPATPVWQRNYYEHVIRNEKSLNKIREYVQNNPLKWDLDQYNPQKTFAKKIKINKRAGLKLTSIGYR